MCYTNAGFLQEKKKRQEQPVSVLGSQDSEENGNEERCQTDFRKNNNSLNNLDSSPEYSYNLS